MSKFVRCLPFLLLPAIAGCEQIKSSNPLSPVIAGPIAGVEITPPTMLQPSDGRGILDTEQPVILLVGNATTNSVRPYSLRFEVAADPGFSSVVVKRDGIPPGTEASTRLVLGDRLQAGRKYFWRAQADDGANKSDWSATYSFELLVPIIIGTPQPRSPIANVTVDTMTPEFRVGNGTSSGPHSALWYQFQISAEPNFVAVITNADVAQDPGGETRYRMPTLPFFNRLFYWRVRIYDSTTSGSWARVESFVSPAAPVATPGPGPGLPVSGNWQACSALVNDKPGLVQCVHAAINPGPSSARAFEVTKRVAWLLRDEGAGLLIKDGGENIIGFAGYSFSIGRIVYPNGRLVKIMSDVGDGGANSPGWHEEGVDPGLRNRYVPAINPGG